MYFLLPPHNAPDTFRLRSTQLCPLGNWSIQVILMNKQWDNGDGWTTELEDLVY